MRRLVLLATFVLVPALVPDIASAQLNQLLNAITGAINNPAISSPQPAPPPTYPPPSAPSYAPAYQPPAQTYYPPQTRAPEETSRSVSPSFDCEQARSASELEICRSPTLSRLDVELADVYKDAIAGPDGSDVVTQQRSWRRLRDKCRGQFRCLRQSMEARLAQLRSLAPASTAIASSGATPEQQPQSFNTLSSADDGAVSVLAQSGPGIRQIAVQSLDGASLISNDDFGNLLMLIRAKRLAPNIDENTMLRLAATWLDATTARKLVYFDRWVGDNEFARQRSEEEFRNVYLAPLLRKAPQPPFRFALSFSADLQLYDQQRGGFAVKEYNFVQGMTELGARSGVAVNVATQVPDDFWTIKASEAEQALDRLGPYRAVTIVRRFELEPTKGGASGAATLRLLAQDLYTRDLKTKLYSFSVKQDRVAGMEASNSAALHFSGPVPVDSVFECAEAYEVSAGHLPDGFGRSCWNLVAARDAALYANNGALDDLRPGDGAWPFFPRGIAGDYSTGADGFARWMLAYAAGVAEAGAKIECPAGYNDYEQGIFHAFSSSKTSYAAIAQAAGGSLQSDQLFAPFQAESGTPLIGALPNSASLYSIHASPASYNQFRGSGARIETTARVGHARFATSGSLPVLLVDFEPISGVLLFGDRNLGSRGFQDVPHLNGASFEPLQAAVARPSQPLLMDGGLVDLLAAAYVGDKLPPETLAHMVMRRWYLENGKDAVLGDGRGGGTPFASAGAVADPARFFIVGKRRPTRQEAVDLREAFLHWAKAAAPPLPLSVITPGRVVLRSGTAPLDWNGLAIFGYGSNQLLDPEQGSFSCASLSKQAGPDLWTPQRNQECLTQIALRHMVSWLDKVQAGRPAIGLVNDGLDYSDPTDLYVWIPHDLPAPNIQIIGSERAMLLDAAFQITGVSMTPNEPAAVDWLPAPLRTQEFTAQPQPSGMTGVASHFVVLNATFQSSTWRDLNGQQVAVLGPNAGQSLTDILAHIQSNLVKPDATAANLDLLGIRLGMSFDDAEKIIRAHIKVGRVLQGERAFAPGAKLGEIQPLNSGKLFIRDDGKEAIALLDEPPAVSGRVLAVWRRLYVDPNIASSDEILDSLKTKYGKLPGRQQLVTWQPLVWGSLGDTGSCIGEETEGERTKLMQNWHDDGQGDPHFAPVGFMPGVTTASWGPEWPSEIAELAQRSIQQPMNCGTFLRVLVDDASQARLPTHYVDEVLADIDQYTHAFEASRQDLRKAAESSSGGASPIKF